ncbi:hypothetical protein OCU04_004295 [Sclerotinia nivalis]|uniref:Protein kinase domain-containing protein n=1 Tax=Sclerotinia nivalis TaxID=352851 RepID=A0A9X0AQH9_9HELO|nr:hypothetical protein OCU04_004295 [Sclerotinia nivalis]
MAASKRAICRVRLPRIDEKKDEEPNLNPPSDLHTKWANAIQKLFSPDPNPDPDTKSSPHTEIRNFDILLNKDGSAENLFQNQQTSPKSAIQLYPPRYQLPEVISARLTTDEEKIARAKLFALGSILYEVCAGHPLFHDADEIDESENTELEGVIQNRIATGKFPEDFWNSPLTPRILACWCPGFLKEMLILSEKEKGIGNYIKKHPYRFSFQVIGGLITAASIAVVPVLGVVGFSAAGPVAGSAAAAWQSSIGLVEAGSIFAWCQSVAMGGAAVGGIIGAGVGGAGLLARAAGLGVLDGVEFDGVELREMFLVAWGREVRGE